MEKSPTLKNFAEVVASFANRENDRDTGVVK
jgi:hypothetical protein